ncbi:S8 family peptidase [Limnovirga soli]|uniref:S8 family serine peptidase n=1 Tax=Limnovirga soli TaxID=2656915 RepID=A0A8J8FJE5_9BACT|nr:S8/S53 family peptidase [Limnovirga soli]NNV56154.1 S8 family serine peptidase [Limnovirga soli]
MASFNVKASILNVRTAPVENFIDKGNVIAKLFKNAPFESVDEKINKLGTWYQDANNHWVWGEGLNPTIIKKSLKQILYPSWMLELCIPQLWMHSKGKGVGVAVIDTGINPSISNLKYNTDIFYSYNKTSVLDSFGHGTHCAGIIGADHNSNEIFGVAPESHLTICKISEDDFISENDTIRYAEAIEWCNEHDFIHIISISWGSIINNGATLKRIQDAINDAARKNKIIICSIGDASQFNDPGPVYPAALKNTISIGVIPIPPRLYSFINDSLTTITFGNEIKSYSSTQQPLVLSGSSQSNAIIAGIVALFISKNNFRYDFDKVKTMLIKSSIETDFNGKKLPVLNGNLLLNNF